MKLYVDEKPEDCFDCPLEYMDWYDDDGWTESIDICPVPGNYYGCPLICLKDKPLLDSLEYDYRIGTITADRAQEILEEKGVNYCFECIVDRIREEG